MSTHNICFRSEIRKIPAFFGWKKRLICCYGISQNFKVDHQFCKTDWSSINSRLAENMIWCFTSFSPWSKSYWEDGNRDYERLCAVSAIIISWISFPAGFEPRTLWSEVGSANFRLQKITTLREIETLSGKTTLSKLLLSPSEKESIRKNLLTENLGYRKANRKLSPLA